MSVLDFLLQVVVAFLGAVFGVLMARLLPGEKSSPRSSVDVNRNVIQGDVYIDNSDNRLMIGPADVTQISMDAKTDVGVDGDPRVKLLIDQQKAQEKRHKRELDQTRAPGARTNDNDWADVVFLLVVGLAVAAALVLLLIQFRSEIILTAMIVGSFAFGFSISAVVYGAVRKVKLSPWLIAQIITDAVIAIALMFSLSWLYGPPAGVDLASYHEFVERSGITLTNVMEVALDEERRSVFWTLAFQSIGVITLVASLGLVIWHSLSLFVTMSLALEATAKRPTRSSALARLSARLLGKPNRLFWQAVALAVFSLALTSGTLSHFSQVLVEHHQKQFSEVTTPPPPLTPSAVPTP